MCPCTHNTHSQRDQESRLLGSTKFLIHGNLVDIKMCKTDKIPVKEYFVKMKNVDQNPASKILR